MTVEFLSHPAFWIVLAAVSELIGMSPLKSQQHHPACPAGPVRHQAGKALKPNIGPVTLTLFTTKPRDAEAKALINEAKTLASIDQQVDAWHAAQPKAPDPVIIEHPIDPVLPGDSQLLGGAMEIKAPWKRD
jgi:hypothetical protein